MVSCFGDSCIVGAILTSLLESLFELIGLAIVRLSAVLSQDSTGVTEQVAHKPIELFIIIPIKLPYRIVPC